MKKTVLLAFLGLTLFAAPHAHGQTRDSLTTLHDRDSDDEDEQPEAKEHRKSHRNVPQYAACGIEGGLHFADMNLNNTVSGVLIGIRAGAFTDIPLSKQVFLRPGIFYAENGGSGVIYSYSSGTYVWEIHTISVPLHLLVKFGRPGNNRFFLGGGPSIGYNVSGSITPSDINGGTLKIGSSSEDDIKALNIGFGLNGGFELRSGLFFNLRTEYGLSNLAPYAAGKVYTAGSALQVGYIFGRGAVHRTRKPRKDDEYIDRRM